MLKEFDFFVRIFLNFFVLLIVIWGIYYPSTRRKEYVFSYALMSMAVFFVAYLLSAVKIELGFALGLFAIFGIIRYRTTTMPIREMTYLFLIIAIAIINGVGHADYLFPQIILANVLFVVIAWLLERLWMNKGEQRKTIVYERIDLVKPERREELKKDIEQRTGLIINRIEIGEIDFLKDVARVVIYFSSPGNDTNLSDYEMLDNKEWDEA
jgi:hypothetical protein